MRFFNGHYLLPIAVLFLLAPTSVDGSSRKEETLTVQTFQGWNIFGGDPQHSFNSNITFITQYFTKEEWKCSINGGGNVFSVDRNGNSYVPTIDGSLVCIDKSGRAAWTFTGEGDATSRQPLIGEDGRIYYSTDQGHVYSVLPDGKLSWSNKFELKFSRISAPMFHKNGSVIVCLDNCSIVWIGEGGQILKMKEFAHNSFGMEMMAVDSKGNTIYNMYRGDIISLDPDGNVNWRFRDGGLVLSLVIGVDDRVLATSSEGYLTCLNPNGSTSFRTSIPGMSAGCTAVADNGTIYSSFCVDQDGFSSGIIASFTSEGNLKWKAPGPYPCSHPLILANGDIMVGGNSILQVFAPNGSVRWSFSPPLVPRLSSPVVTGPRTFLTIDGGKLFGFRSIESYPPVNVTTHPRKAGVLVRWEPPIINGSSTIVEYWVYRSKFTGVLAENTLVGNTTGFEILDTLAPDGYHYYHVRTLTSDGLSDRSEFSYICYNRPSSDPEAPLVMKDFYHLKIRGTKTDGIITIEIDLLSSGITPEDIEFLVLKRSVSSYGEFLTLAYLDPNSDEYIDESFPQGDVRYYIEVHFKDGSQNDSNTITVNETEDPDRNHNLILFGTILILLVIMMTSMLVVGIFLILRKIRS